MFKNIYNLDEKLKHKAIKKFKSMFKKSNKNIKEIFHNEWLSLMEIVVPEEDVNGYVYSHETRCDGKIIVVLPFRKNGDKLEFGLRKEVTPCWSLKPEISSLTGGYEGGDPRDTAILELKEEAGFEAKHDELIDLGTSYVSKSSDTVYYLYAIDVTDKKSGEATGDGTKQDAEGTIEWFERPQSDDPQVAVIYLRLLRHFGEKI